MRHHSALAVQRIFQFSSHFDLIRYCDADPTLPYPTLLLPPQEISTLCRSRGLALHLDGARVFNAIVRCGYAPSQLGPLFDTISVCLSKGLGCPVGSVLLGSAEHMARARRVRKVLGGGMRQAGLLAAAGLYALRNHIDRCGGDLEAGLAVWT